MRNGNASRLTLVVGIEGFHPARIIVRVWHKYHFRLFPLAIIRSDLPALFPYAPVNIDEIPFLIKVAHGELGIAPTVWHHGWALLAIEIDRRLNNGFVW